MIRPVEVEAKQEYRIWLRYEDSSSGEVDLSHHVGRGVFKAWDNPAVFENVRITNYGSVAWGDSDDLELCPNDLYMRLTGKTLDDINAYNMTKKAEVA